MAGENEGEVGQPGQGAAPAFDPEKMRGMIREELQQAMNSQDKDTVYAPPEQTGAQPQATTNPLQAVIDPLIAPHMRTVAVAAAGAQDAAVFYSGHPEAVKYQKDIEQAFNQLIQQGTPFTREAVWSWYRGQHFDKFLKEAQQADQDRLNAANNVSDAGGGVRPQGGQVKDAHSATDEELKTALQGVSF